MSVRGGADLQHGFKQLFPLACSLTRLMYVEIKDTEWLYLSVYTKWILKREEGREGRESREGRKRREARREGQGPKREESTERKEEKR